MASSFFLPNSLGDESAEGDDADDDELLEGEQQCAQLGEQAELGGDAPAISAPSPYSAMRSVFALNSA